jgi:hypothetical protein
MLYYEIKHVTKLRKFTETATEAEKHIECVINKYTHRGPKVTGI